jgi:hypothetical protein
MAEPSLTYDQYLAALPPDRRATVDRVWRLVRENIRPGFVEDIGPKFLSYKARGEWYCALANQKNYVSLHLMTTAYGCSELRAKLDASGKKLKMGKGCINFLKPEDLPLDVIAEIVAFYDAAGYAEYVDRVRSSGKQKAEGSRQKAVGS